MRAIRDESVGTKTCYLQCQFATFLKIKLLMPKVQKKREIVINYARVPCQGRFFETVRCVWKLVQSEANGIGYDISYGGWLRNPAPPKGWLKPYK